MPTCCPCPGTTRALSPPRSLRPQVEFEWLRQFWFQGTRYRKCTDWWREPMAQLEDMWRRMEGVVSTARAGVRGVRAGSPRLVCAGEYTRDSSELAS